MSGLKLNMCMESESLQPIQVAWKDVNQHRKLIITQDENFIAADCGLGSEWNTSAQVIGENNNIYFVPSTLRSISNSKCDAMSNTHVYDENFKLVVSELTYSIYLKTDLEIKFMRYQAYENGTRAAIVELSNTAHQFTYTIPLPEVDPYEGSFLRKTAQGQEVRIGWLLKKLVDGSYSHIFIGDKPDPASAVAVKFASLHLSCKGRDNPRTEIQTLQTFRDELSLSEHVSQLHFAGRDAHCICMVMKRCPGYELGAAGGIAEQVRGHVFSAMITRKLFRGIAVAVCALHVRGWSHWDLSLENIIATYSCSSTSHSADSAGTDDTAAVRVETSCKLIDFGRAHRVALSSSSDDDDDMMSISSSSTSASTTTSSMGAEEEMRYGKKHYASPETRWSFGRISSSPARNHLASDVFALGVILFTLLTGRYPFQLRGCSALWYDNLQAQSLRGHVVYFKKEKRTQGDVTEEVAVPVTVQQIVTDADALDLLEHMLAYDPNIRFTISQVLQHRWAQQQDCG